MNLVFSLHAQGNIQKRRIDAAWIEQTIAAPDWTRPDPRHPEVTRAYRSIEAFGGRVLRVAYRPDGADILVITAFFDRGAKT
jgi:hypothetical protein